MDLMEEWLHQANDCIHMNLVRPSSDPDKAERILEEPFNPTFTYALFENDESIIGYKDPKIELDFRATDLKPTLKIQYTQKEDLSGLLGDGRQQTDIDTVFKDYLPASYDSSEPSQSDGSDATSSSWKPPGKRIQSFEQDGKQFEVWSASLADPAALKTWRNMQILPILFIEGASILELDEQWTYERWTLHLLYEVTPLEDPALSPYTIAGFSTSHRYWIFPTFEVMRATKLLPSPPASSNGDSSPSYPPRLELAKDQTKGFAFKEKLDVLQAPSRERISQFLILPPYQQQGLGTKLYETLFVHYWKIPNVYEIPVEDPSEAFDGMRDLSDIAYLRTLPSFQALSLASTLPPDTLKKDSPIPRDLILGNGADLEELRHEAKIVPRQFYRMVELHLLSTIPPLHRNRARITRKAKSSNENDRKYYFWRLALKDRIYRQNADVLDEVRKEDPDQCVETLENAVDSQEKEYSERLEALKRRQDDGAVTGNGRPSTVKRKRNVIVDEEDDWEDVDDEPSASSKKARR